MRIVFDSSCLISVSQTCLINILGGLKKKTEAEFFIPEAVFEEVVKRPISIKRFELNAVRIKKAIDDGWFEIAHYKDRQLFDQIGGTANSCFFAKGRPIRLLQKGEIEALALVKELGAEAFAIDERTTRMLVESPQQLRRLMQTRRNIRIEADKRNSSLLAEMFKGLTIVRSVELIALASQLGLLQEDLPKGEQSLEAALFAAKYSGCAVSSREIKTFLHSLR